MVCLDPRGCVSTDTTARWEFGYRAKLPVTSVKEGRETQSCTIPKAILSNWRK